MSKTLVHRLYVGMIDNNGKEYSQKDLTVILDKYYLGYCITLGVGGYKGEKEPCYIVDLFDYLLGYQVINELKERLNQECILVYSWEVEGGFE